VTMNIKDLEQETGTLSQPGKMPAFSYSTPATKCKIGSALRKVEGSVCADCTACKGRYRFGNVQTALETRFNKMAQPTWPVYMVRHLRKKYSKMPREKHYHRWFDSGDLQGERDLDNLIYIARELPWISFWIPTKEYLLLQKYKPENMPDNLNIRVSAPMVGTWNGLENVYSEKENVQYLLDNFHACVNMGWTISTVNGKGVRCPSKQQGHKCLDCRQCWDKTIHEISYDKG